ncbi:TetR/AcrR family transcriptional regulator [Mycobacterium sp. CVI_P3]|uniref:TetR/AcrR family transcriptional regulator n=1 Tax=Mycobacterium pinniadriaticum TaxID=2994102 RepID=A0ABT3SBK4_9MYCO|nr:TetR/AcrR family transcriptional regulator [Mycobacterium pinniadriaticum]MCX2930056.1 TetR/AcrR family transcriptional regulator [Mycobacterium pinniadriaticum]MCX2936295.1 TetR/AcrR family transcriptional regulator [Mycobacterium pinniadriaticum]
MADLRERKKAALRATIVRSAIKLFVERSYDTVGVEEIADASMCSRSTFNRYFGTKDDVLFPGAREVVAGLRDALHGASATADRWAVARIAVITQLRVFFDTFDTDLRVTCMRLWFTEPAPRRRYLEIAYEFEEILKGYFATGLPDDAETHMRVQVLASAMVSALRAVLHATIESGNDVGELAESAFAMIETGVPATTLASLRAAAAS